MLHSGLRLGGRYRLDARIGAGGMGEVWRAVDDVLGRVVAVKAMLPHVAGEDGFATRFLVEAKAMASVNHPGVASIHDYGSSDGVTFLVMEFIDGQSLSDLLERVGRLGPADVMRLVAQAADGLQAVHDGGIVHRDIKPANLLVRRNGTLLITDFGISRTQDGPLLTATGALLGTPTYLSPEQVLGQPATARSDIYSLGLAAYECLTGRRPFEGDSPYAVALQRLRTPPPALGGDVPPSVAAVLDAALAVDPAHRWPTAAALADAARAAGTAAAADRAARPVTGGDRRPGLAPPLAPPAPARSTPSSLSRHGLPSHGAPPSHLGAPSHGAPTYDPPPSHLGAPSLDAPSRGRAPSDSPPSHLGQPSLAEPPPGPPALAPAPAKGTRRSVLVALLAVLVVAGVGLAWRMDRDRGGNEGVAAGADGTSPDAGPTDAGPTDPTQPGTATTGPARSGAPSPGAGSSGTDDRLAPAGLGPCDDGFCPTAPQCWGGLVSISGRTESPRAVDCAEPHYWETFVAIDPPADVGSGSEDELIDRPDIAAGCSAEVMATHSRDPSRTGSWERTAWLIEVPGMDVRLLHCLASSEEGESTGPAFTP